MMSVTKVVKVEEISHPGDGSTDQEGRMLQSFASPSRGMIKDDVSFTKEFANRDGNSLADLEANEAYDEVYPLPANWPKISRLNRRRSCELTKSTAPCVQKAVSHLELLQNIIDDWFKRTEEEVKSRMSSQSPSIPSPTAPRKQLRFLEDHTSTMSSGMRTRTTSGASHASAESLSVRGIGGKADEDQYEEEADLPYLGAEDVIEEVITLLARLDNDRHETLDKLKKEKQKVDVLSGKIDDLCLRRLRDLPILVQREHEACILDLNELQWHVAYRGRNETRMFNRKEIAEVLNNRLKEDIEFVKRHIPLVQEKLLLEMEAMDKIKKAQSETDQELELTKQRQAKTEQKSEEAVNKAENERGHIKRELDTVRDNLSQISEDLFDAKMTFNSYLHQVNEIRNQLKDNEGEMLVLEVKSENAKAAEEMQAVKVRDFQGKIAESEMEHKKLKGENQQLEQKFRSMKAKNTRRRDELHQNSKQMESKLRALILKSQEVDMEIRDGEDKIAACDRQKVYDEKNVARINKEMLRTEGLMAATMEEYMKVATINQHIQEQLRDEEDKAFKIEEQLKNQIEVLKKQMKDEVHNRTVLQARINSDNSEIDKSRLDSAKKKNKAEKVADEVDTAVNGVLEKVVKLRNAKEEKVRLKEELKAKIESLKLQTEESQADFMERLTHMEPRHEHLQSELLKLSKRLDHMDWKSEMMNKKLDDMDASETMMEKIIRNTQKISEKLTLELEELNIQLDDAKKIEDDLRQSYNEALDRKREAESKHSKLLESRQQVLKEHQGEKRRSLYQNKNWASRYRQLQNEFIIMKERLLRGYENKVKLEGAITDVRQLQSLQKKLHGALMEYFKLSGKYNQTELSKLGSESSHNAQRVAKLQGEMDNALVNIAHFLQNQMDGETARKMAWDTIQMQEEARAKGLKTPLPEYASRPSTVVSS